MVLTNRSSYAIIITESENKMIIERGRLMDEKVWIQCNTCGHLHRVKDNVVFVSEDDLYTKPIFCCQCRDETKHLVIGEYRDMVYQNGDCFLDDRYFIYNTK